MPRISFQVLLTTEKMKEGFNVAEFFEDAEHFQVMEKNLVFKASAERSIEFDFAINSKKGSHIITMKPTKNVHWKHMSLYDDFNVKLNSFIKRKGMEYIHLSKELSKYYSEKLYPYFHVFENELRRLMHLIFTYESDMDWQQELLDETKKKAMSKRKKENRSEQIIDESDFSFWEDFLFGENYIQVKSEKGKTRMMLNTFTSNELLSHISEHNNDYRVYSIWDEFCTGFPNESLQRNIFEEDFKKLVKVRNAVAHHKKLTYNDYKQAEKILKEAICELSKRNDDIVLGEPLNVNLLETIKVALEGYRRLSSLTRASLESITEGMNLLSKTFSGLTIYQNEGLHNAITSFGTISRKLGQTYDSNSKTFIESEDKMSETNGKE